MKLIIKDERASGRGVSMQFVGTVEESLAIDACLGSLRSILGETFTIANVMHPQQYITVTWEHLSPFRVELQTPLENDE